MYTAAQEQTEPKRIAILETVDKTDKVDYAYELQLRQSLTFAINKYLAIKVITTLIWHKSIASTISCIQDLFLTLTLKSWVK